ncbi:MAG: NUDIX domain-containing protein [Acidimicrobiia bacterium]
MVGAVSAGVLLFSRGEEIQVLLVHPGGPFWKNKSDGVWSVPKGEFDPAQEDPETAARREFSEELGHPVPSGDAISLGEVTQKAGKRVFAWAIEGWLDPEAIVSNTFTMEWPPRSGRQAEFPEVDRAEWFTLEAAQQVINSAQVGFLDRLAEAVG